MVRNETSLTIRQIGVDDAGALREIRLESLHAHPVAFSADPAIDAARPLSEWQERIRANPIFMAWDGETAAGMTGFYRNPSYKTQHHGVIWGVYVRPAYRGLGLGGRLVTAAVDWARENGLKMAYIAAAAGNTAAIRCYARCGFSAYGLQPMAIYHDGVYHDELLMAQAL
ncbi:MAG: GNAT family N-acetyltransferase [Candidatus Promineifilaceae bacterium]